MVQVYESLIIKGEKQIGDVPEGIRNDVKEALIRDGYLDLTKG